MLDDVWFLHGGHGRNIVGPTTYKRAKIIASSD